MTHRNLTFAAAILISTLAASCSNYQESPYFGSDGTDPLSPEVGSHYNEQSYDPSTNRYQTANPHEYANHNTMTSSTTQHTLSRNEQLTMQPLMDPQSGMPYGHYPLPASWSIKKDGWYGPNGIKVEFFNNPVQNAQQIPFESPQQFLNSKVAPMIRKEGGNILRTYDLPAVAKNERDYRNLMKLQPGIQNTVSALAVEVRKDNETGLMIIKAGQNQSPYLTLWDQGMIILSAQPTKLEEAKQALIYALSNFKPNMQQIQWFKQKELQKTNRSMAGHNARMKNNQRNFEARNQATQSAYAAVNDATMGSYQSQSSSFDRSNQQIHNGIYNENTTTSPFDGTSHQTDAMYDRTFINAFGEQIQTNDQFYTPATGYEEVYSNDGGY